MNKHHPYISIVIPTLNSGKFLDRCLKSLTKLDYPKNKLEILIVDGGSKDNTLDIAKKYSVSIVFENNTGRGAAYNKGLKEAKGEYIAFLDSDAFAQRTWLKKAIEVLNRDPLVAIVYFRNKAPKNSSYFQKCIDVLQTKSWGQANGAVCRKSLLEKVGGFKDLLYHQEDELRLRLIRAGYKVKVISESVIYHLPRKNIWSYFLQSIESGIGFAHLCAMTLYYKWILYALVRCIIALLPLILYTQLLFAPILFKQIFILFLIACLTSYLIYLWIHTDKDYRSIKYILPATALVYISALGNVIGYISLLKNLIKCILKK